MGLHSSRLSKLGFHFFICQMGPTCHSLVTPTHLSHPFQPPRRRRPPPRHRPLVVPPPLLRLRALRPSSSPTPRSPEASPAAPCGTRSSTSTSAGTASPASSRRCRPRCCCGSTTTSPRCAPSPARPCLRPRRRSSPSRPRRWAGSSSRSSTCCETRRRRSRCTASLRRPAPPRFPGTTSSPSQVRLCLLLLPRLPSLVGARFGCHRARLRAEELDLVVVELNSAQRNSIWWSWSSVGQIVSLLPWARWQARYVLLPPNLM